MIPIKEMVLFRLYDYNLLQPFYVPAAGMYISGSQAGYAFGESSYIPTLQSSYDKNFFSGRRVK